jgi:hypothetical protein
MHKPLEFCLRHLDPGYAAQLEPIIRKRVARLARYLDDIIGCRVVVDRPQLGHHSHNPYRVRLSVTVPPQTRLVVAHRPLDPDASALDVVQAAFDKLERQLDAFADQRRLDVKEHTRTGMPARS